MKSSDIKVGEAYAWKPYAHSKGYRVVVRETRVERRQTSYSSYGRRVVRDGVKVERDDGTERVVSSREISQPWQEYETESKRQTEMRRDAEAYRRRAAEERIRLARRVDDALQATGVEAKERHVWLIHDADLLKKYYSVKEDDIAGHVITSAFNSPNEVLKKGVVPVTEILPLLDGQRP